MPTLRFLKTFQVAARLLSFKAAADELHVTPSAVSHQIKLLERQVGVVLFARSTRSLTLTSAGAAYLDHLNEAFSRLEYGTDQLRRRYSRKIVRLIVPPFFADEFLVPRLSRFTADYADTDILIETVNNSPSAHAGEADLSIVVGAGPWDGVRAVRLFPQSFTPVASPDFLQKNDIRRSTDLDGHTLIVQENRSDAWDRWAHSLGHAPFETSQVVRLDSLSAIARAAEQGVGLALVPTRLCAERFATGKLVKVFDFELATNESYFLLHRHDDGQREEIRALKRWIVRQCRGEDLPRLDS